LSKYFDKGGNPHEVMKVAQEERLTNWDLVQELAVVIKVSKEN